MGRPQIFIHIGTNKTGTTAIQQYFNESYDELAKLGVLYPKCIRKILKGRIHQAHHDFAWYLGFGKNRSRLFDKTNFSERIKKELESTHTEKIFISSEFFGLNKIEGIKAIKNEFKGYEIRIVVYLRKQDKYLESAYKQSVKNGHRNDISSFILNKHYNYYELINVWQENFGKQNLIVKIYDDQNVKTNIEGNLLSDLGIKQDQVEIKPKVNRLNDSLLNHHIDVIRKLNIVSKKANKTVIFEFFNAFFNNNTFLPDNSSLLSKDQIISIYKNSEESNEKVRACFLPDRKSLFDWDLEEDLKNHKEFVPIKYPKSVLRAFYGAITGQIKEEDK